jgi:hypothetical protein
MKKVDIFRIMLFGFYPMQKKPQKKIKNKK